MARYKFTTSGNYITFKDTDNVVATLHNTSRAVEWKYDSTGGLTWWVDNIKYQTDDIANIEFDGVACNSQDDFETGIEAMFPNYAEAEGGSVVGYPEGTKMYLALLTQTSTNAPVATVLVNTLGGTVVWSYEDFGFYKGTLSNAFAANKTVVMFTNPIYANNGMKASRENESNIYLSGDSDYGSTTYPFVLQILVTP